MNCSSLKSIDLSNGIGNIGDKVFLNCTSLEDITFPSYRFRSIGESCFENCYSLKKLFLPESVTSIGSNLCRNAGVEEVVIPNCKTIGGQSHFIDCRNLTKATISCEGPLPSYFFAGCTSLKHVSLNKVTEIGLGAFLACQALESIALPGSVETIGIEAFHGCNKLEAINIPSSVTTIYLEAFRGCNALATMTLPESVSSLSYRVFYECSSLKLLDFRACTKVTFDDPDERGTNTFLHFSGIPETTVVLLPGDVYPSEKEPYTVLSNNNTSLCGAAGSRGTGIYGKQSGTIPEKAPQQDHFPRTAGDMAIQHLCRHGTHLLCATAYHCRDSAQGEGET